MDRYKITTQNIIIFYTTNRLLRRRGNKLFYGRTDSKKRSVGWSVGHIFYFFYILCQNYPKTIMIFSCSLRSKFSFKFLSKKGMILQYLGVKQGFLFSWPNIKLSEIFRQGSNFDVMITIDARWLVLDSIFQRLSCPRQTGHNSKSLSQLIK